MKDSGVVQPVVITDKNGRITTVRKRVGGSNAGSSVSVAAPTIARPEVKRREFKPTKAQLKEVNHSYDLSHLQVDSRFHQFLPHGRNTTLVNFTASDEEVYAALSKFNTVDNALCYLFTTKEGIPLSDEHKEVIQSIVHEDKDREELMRGAYERRISSYSFVEFHRRYSSSDNGKGAYLDAAQVQSIPSLNKTPGLTQKVYRGDIFLSDVMRVGVQAVRMGSRYGDPKRNLERLESLKDGSANFTAEQLGTVLSQYNTREYANTMIMLLDNYGGEFAASIKDGKQAHSILLLCRDKGIVEVREPIAYANKFNVEGVFRNHKQIFDLYEAGVDVDFAIEKSRVYDEYSVQQIIALHAGISNPITDGWL